MSNPNSITVVNLKNFVTWLLNEYSTAIQVSCDFFCGTWLQELFHLVPSFEVLLQYEAAWSGLLCHILCQWQWLLAYFYPHFYKVLKAYLIDELHNTNVDRMEMILGKDDKNEEIGA